MDFHFTIDVTVDRVEGRFASREELESQIQEELEAVVGSMQLQGEHGGVYEVSDYNIAT